MHLTADLAYWINERYAMKLRKETPEFELLAHGYSPDPNMGTVRYCNVHREDDRVTKWIRTHWNRAGDPAWKFVLGRMVNLPSTLQQILWGWEQHPQQPALDQAKLDMQVERSMGKKVWTAAYTISTCGRAMDKIDYVFDHVVAGVLSQEKLNNIRHDDCAFMWRSLQTVDGLGSFLSAQVVADMKNTKGHPLADAEDWWTFSAPGPGSLRGLSWYFTGTPTGVTAGDYQKCLDICRSEVDPLVANYVPRISNQDFQNCLCEFSKYMKVKVLNGHVRNRYVARIQSN